MNSGSDRSHALVHLLRSFFVLVILLALSGFVFFETADARQSMDEAELTRLAVEFEQQYEARRGPEFFQYAQQNGLEDYLDVHNGVEFVGLTDEGRPIFYTIENLNAAFTTRAFDLWPGGSTGLNLSGAFTNTLAVWDAGNVLASHQEFNNTGIPRVENHDNGSTHYHSTHVAGTLIAGGVQYVARGMSFEAFLDAYDWDSDESEMASAALSGTRISNHSYGYTAGWWYSGGTGWHWLGDPDVNELEDWTFGYYDQNASDYDLIAENAPEYLICASAGNDRNDDGPGPGQGYWLGYGTDVWSTDPRDPDGGYDGYDCINDKSLAKNVLSVGAVNDVQTYSGPGSVSMSSFSSWGPTDDGRIKPDLVANGVSLYSTLDDNDDDYGSLSGTSMSSPNAAGTLNLLHQYYMQIHGEMPLSSTLKAVAIHTADECGPWDGPDYMYGWGLLNAHAAADVITFSNDVPQAIQEPDLIQGQTWTDTFTSDGDESIRVTIAWVDPAADPLPGSPFNDPTPMLVNNLDLRLRNLDTDEVYQPYVLGGLADPDQPAGPGDNNVDNVEQIYIENPVAGDYQVEVSHDPGFTGLQTFSVIMTGMSTDTNVSYLVLTPQNDTVPAGGGVILYGAELNNATAQTFNLDAWTMVTLPNGNEYGPVMNLSFNLSPGLRTFGALQLNVPANAPSGDYQFTANVGFYPNYVGLTDNFSFTKSATGVADTDAVSPDDWYAEPWQVTAGIDETVELPEEFGLSSAWPNPFNAATTLQLQLPSDADVQVIVVDVQGRTVATLANGRLSGGTHSLSWTADTNASGMYFVHALADGQSVVQKVVLIR